MTTDSLNKAACTGLAAAIVLVAATAPYGDTKLQKVLGPTADALIATLSVAVSINYSTSFLEQLSPKRVTAERPQFNNGRPAWWANPGLFELL